MTTGEIMIKAVFLDIDGTLLDFDAYVRDAMITGFREFGLPEYREEMWEVFERINNGLWKRIEQGTLTIRELRNTRWQLIFGELGFEADGTGFEDYFRGRLFSSAIPVSGADELMKYLAGRYIICAASNGPFLQQQNRIRLAGWSDIFDYLFISETLGVSKPDTAFFDRALDILKADGHDVLPGEILMIGDSLSSDMTGGINAGLKTCWYDPRGKSTELKPDYVISALDQLKSIL